MSLFQQFSIVYISRSKHEIQDFSFIIDNQMQLEPEKPSHRAFSTCSQTLKSLVYKYALIPANT